MLDPGGDIDMDGLMLFSLFVGVVSFTLLYVWLLMHRTRAMAMEDLLDDAGSRRRRSRPSPRQRDGRSRWKTPGSSSAATS